MFEKASNYIIKVKKYIAFEVYFLGIGMGDVGYVCVCVCLAGYRTLWQDMTVKPLSGFRFEPQTIENERKFKLLNKWRRGGLPFGPFDALSLTFGNFPKGVGGG